ncbi:VOC family protein [Desulfosporosinus fructosivorans]|uniref:Bleomycin resistance protein n=1 Tax=Desulfosporosinus fructosivorans TaxID=2018669 RepID=A0A4Z0R1Q1_9FIRM|nr:VOC family protein [Desulfosporosinus fructosivorans]TGE36305.1 VOC family protein [Desulfosporosinus fructosivorans]
MIFNKMVPELSVSNINISKKFYIDTLGFKVEYEREEDKFAFISLDGVQLMLDEGVNGSWSTGITEYPFGRGINFQFFVGDVKNVILNLSNNNIKFFKEPFVSEYRIDSEMQVFEEILVQDPDGYLLRFSELQQKD